VPLAACTRQHPQTTNKYVSTAKSLGDQKTNFRSIIYKHISARAENMAKIGTADFEIIGLTGIIKNKFYK